MVDRIGDLNGVTVDHQEEDEGQEVHLQNGVADQIVDLEGRGDDLEVGSHQGETKNDTEDALEVDLGPILEEGTRVDRSEVSI